MCHLKPAGVVNAAAPTRATARCEFRLTNLDAGDPSFSGWWPDRSTAAFLAHALFA